MVKEKIKYLLWAVAVILVSIQFVPVNREMPESDKNKDFLVITQAPENVQEAMRNSCYDCHSNETKWPWYSYIAPISFVIANHVEEGRDHLNFSKWATYDANDYPDILKHINQEIEKGGMPIAGYAMIHTDAKMTDERKELIINWMNHFLKNTKHNIDE